MPRKMNSEDWDKIDFPGQYLTLKEGQGARVEFLTGFWFFEKGEENFLGQKEKYGGWRTKVILPPDDDEKIMTGQTTLQRALKEEIRKNNLSFDIFDTMRPIFKIRRVDKYNWEVKFEGYGEKPIEDKKEGKRGDIGTHLSLKEEIVKILISTLKETKTIKKMFIKNLVKVKLSPELKQREEVDEIIDDILQNDPRFFEMNNEVMLRFSDDDIIKEIISLIGSNDDKRAKKSVIFDLIAGVYNLTETEFDELVKKGGIKTEKDMLILDSK